MTQKKRLKSAPTSRTGALVWRWELECSVLVLFGFHSDCVYSEGATFLRSISLRFLLDSQTRKNSIRSVHPHGLSRAAERDDFMIPTSSSRSDV